MFSVDEWNPKARYLIIDDIEWKYIPCKKALFGAQRRFTITDKYRKKKTIKWGKPTIMLYNEDGDPMSDMSRAEREWYDINTTIINLSNKLY